MGISNPMFIEYLANRGPLIDIRVENLMADTARGVVQSWENSTGNLPVHRGIVQSIRRNHTLIDISKEHSPPMARPSHIHIRQPTKIPNNRSYNWM
jgi:hypothetical protein